MRRAIWLTAIVASLTTLMTFGRAADLEANLDRYFAPHVASHDFSGVVLIAKGDNILARRSYGMANFESSVPNTPETKFRIASLTKTFTAAAMVVLQEK